MSARRSILLADDELGYRDLFRFAFEPLGFEVVTVKDGLEAMEALRRRSFDIVVLDVHMPRMGGPEALPQIRALHPSQRVIIISSSSDPSRSFEARATAFGAVDCLFKPMALDELLAAVARALVPEPHITGGLS